MITQTSNTPSNLTTTQRYHPVAAAMQAKMKARETWTQAYERWETSPTVPNRNALVAASIAFRKAEDDLKNAEVIWKHNKGTVVGDVQSRAAFTD